MHGTESDRWPKGRNTEQLTDAQTEESGEEEKETGGEQGGMRRRECILTGCSWFSQALSVMEKLPVYSGVLLRRSRGGTVITEEKLASQMLHLGLMLKHLRASPRNAAQKHAVCFAM